MMKEETKEKELMKLKWYEKYFCLNNLKEIEDNEAMKKVSIILLNYNNSDDTITCVESMLLPFVYILDFYKMLEFGMSGKWGYAKAIVGEINEQREEGSYPWI